MKKSIITVSCFILIFSLIFNHFQKIYSFKFADGIYGLKAFYNQEDNINDVIFIGSSNIFENINTQILWDEFGIASFDLAGSMQPMWNSYYYMKEALKTQSPRLFVLDLLGVLWEGDYLDSSRIIKNTYGMKNSLDKIEAVKISAPKANWNDYLWEVPTYHIRYQELTAGDYLPNNGTPNWESWKGFGINTETMVCDRPEGFETDETLDISSKSEKYLRKICQLCRDNDVELLLIKTPYVTDIDSTMKYNRAAEIGAEYGVPCVDFNYYYDEIGLDFNTDLGDGLHLNYRGNIKFTRYLAEYIESQYDIPDRRGEDSYESYDIISLDCIMRTHNAMVRDTQDFDMFINEILNENYIIICSICGDFKGISNYDIVRNKIYSLGIDLNLADVSAVWVIQNGNTLFEAENGHNDKWHMELAPYKNIQIATAWAPGDAPSIQFNRKEQVKVSSGINIVVYDSVTETIVDAVGFQISEGILEYSKQ